MLQKHELKDREAPAETLLDEFQSLTAPFANCLNTDADTCTLAEAIQLAVSIALNHATLKKIGERCFLEHPFLRASTRVFFTHVIRAPSEAAATACVSQLLSERCT